MDVRSARTHRFFKNGLQQLDDRRLLGPRRRSQQLAKLDRHVAQIGGQLLGQTRDFLGAPINAVNQ